MALTVHVRLLETFPWSKVKISCHLRKRRQMQELKQQETLSRNSSADDLEGISQDSNDLVDLQDAINLAAFVLLLLHLLGEALPLTLLNSVGIFEGPASPPIRLAHVIAGVAAPANRNKPVISGFFSSPDDD